jgi:GNAT superfamily N-acetyltransferase
MENRPNTPDALPAFRMSAPDDLPQLIRLRVLMQREIHSLGESEISASDIESIRDFFVTADEQGTCITAVADDNGQLVASAGLVIYRKPPSLPGGKDTVGYVTNVYTSLPWRGRGIATKLMEILVEQARSRRVYKLHLSATKAGQSVYEGVGFQSDDEYMELRFQTGHLT